MIKLPDILEIKPLKQPPHATITVPGSKSITNRALILAALTNVRCELRGALWADDTQVMVDSLRKLGFEVEYKDETEECNKTISVTGHDGSIPERSADLYVGDAGTAARFLTALVCLGQGEYHISGSPRMHERPMRPLFDALRKLGATIVSDNNDNRLPAKIVAKGLHGGTVDVPVDQSSQFLSALVLVQDKIPAPGLTLLNVLKDELHGYVAMTRRMEFHPDKLDPTYSIEPDLSSASYFEGARFLTKGSIQVADWPAYTDSRVGLQMDGQFRKHLSRLNEREGVFELSREEDLGDSVMTMAICTLFGQRPMELVKAARMRLQECDRIRAMVTELNRVGAKTEERQDGFIVWPSDRGQLHGAEIETYKDHRMAMSFSVLGLKIPGIRIKNPSCVSKTFPNFFDKLKQLGAELIDVKTGKAL